jgi:hypothetical protein
MPNLLDLPDDPDADDRPVFLCPEHRGEYDRAAAFGLRSRQMLAFMMRMGGLNDEDELPPEVLDSFA